MIAAHIAQWALSKRNNSDHHADAVVGVINGTPKKRKKKAERVLSTKGGDGYQGGPAAPTPMQQAEARQWEAAQEQEREDRAQQRIDDKAKIEKDAKDAAWLSGKNTAYTGAKTAGQSKLKSLGIDAGDQWGAYDQFNTAIDAANAGLQSGADYSGAFSGTILDEILGNTRTTQRTKYKNDFGNLVGETYADDRFGGTSDDAILNAILDQQYTDALAGLNRSRDRGITNSATYERALQNLGGVKTTANTDLQNIGRTVREGIGKDINTRRTGSLDKAANWDFGSTYDPTGEAGRITGYADERFSGLEGDLRGAVGDKSYFDLNALLGKAAGQVGSQTTGSGTSGTNALYDTFENEAKKNNTNVKQTEGTF